jgi:hypothetical protein
MDENHDPIDDFQLTLDTAKSLATKRDFVTAYYTLAAAYQNLIEQHEQAIEEVIRLRKKVSLSKISP